MIALRRCSPPFHAFACTLAFSSMCLFGSEANAQDDALRFFDQLAYGRTLSSRSDAQKKELKKLNDALSLLNEYRRNVTLKDYALNGGIGFSTFTNVANGDARTNVQVSLTGDFKAGTYPTQHKISGSVQLRNNDGVVFEDLSALHVALDHHPLHSFSEKCGTWWARGFEVFGFVDRTANSYMGVQRRYQGGGGILFGHYSGEVDDPESRKRDVFDETRSQKLDRVKFKEANFGNDSLNAALVEEAKQQELAGDSLVPGVLNANRTKLTRLEGRTKNYLAKKYAKHSFSFLIEAILEDDVVEFTDSLKRLLVSQDSLARPDTMLTVRFVNPAKPRLGFRAKYAWRASSGLSFTASAWAFYWMNPKPWRIAQEAERFALNRDQREAWRIWIPVELSYAPDDYVSVSIEYSYMKEYSPLRRWVPFGTQGGYALFEAPDEFWNLVLKVTLKIK